MSTLKPLFTWRSAICDSGLSPTSRHVALALSLYMSERGDSAHPGATRLAHDTGLSERRVREHLGELVEGGWLVLVEAGGLRGCRRRANSYEVHIPDAPSPVTNDNPGRTVTHDAPSPMTLTTPTPDGDDTRPLTERQPNSPVISPENSPSLAQPDFSAFYAAYPLHKARASAERAWNQAIKKAEPAVIVAAAASYAQGRRGQNPKYTAYPASWLRADRWLDEPDRSPEPAGFAGIRDFLEQQ